MNHTLLNEKYRPQNLDTFVGNENVKQTISQYLSNNDIQNFIFYGPAGSGKTTLAKIIVKNLDCDYLYINASDERGIETIRNKCKICVITKGAKGSLIINKQQSIAIKSYQFGKAIDTTGALSIDSSATTASIILSEMPNLRTKSGERYQKGTSFPFLFLLSEIVSLNCPLPHSCPTGAVKTKNFFLLAMKKLDYKPTK